MSLRTIFSSRSSRRSAVIAGLAATALVLTGCQTEGNAEASSSSVEETTVAETTQVADVGELDTPRLQSADNFRDFAGVFNAMPAGDSHLSSGVIYRSNHLDVTDEDFEVLNDLDLDTIIDLRTPREIEEHPDRVPEGTEWVNVDILGGGTTAANPDADFDPSDPEQAAQMLRDVNRGFIEDPGQREQFGKALTIIADADGPVLYHCTAGKDRAGWTSALLQLASGVSEEDVMENYLATNDFSAERIDATVEVIKEEEGEEYAEGYRVLLGAQEDFLRTSIDLMNEEYGDIDNFLTEGLGLDEETIQKLRDKTVA